MQGLIGHLEVKGKERKECKVGWFDRECEDARILMKGNLRKLRKNSNNLELYVNSKRNYKKLCRLKKKDWDNRWVENLLKTVENEGMREFWRNIKSLRGTKKVKGDITSSEWVNHFKELYGGWETEWDGIEEKGELNIEIGDMDKDIEREEVKKAIQGLKNGKAAGLDGIFGEVYKEMLGKDEFMDVMVELYKKVWQREHIPEDWGTGIIFPLYKGKGVKNDMNAYRGITLLNVAGKIFTKVLASRIMKWVEDNNILVPEQAGFRRGFSTVDNILVINTIVEKELRKEGGKLFCCFIDFEKAFDSVVRGALWEKLKKMGISHKMLRILQRIYSKVGMRVLTGWGEISSGFESKKGVRQGCQLSPILFSLFINDLVDHMRDTDTHAPWIGGRDIKMLLYADDVVLLTETGIGLQKGLDRVREYCLRWGLKVNVGKTKIMVCRKGGRRGKVRKWWYDSEKIEVVKSIKYLGVTMTEVWGWKRQEEEARKAANTAMLVIRRTLGKGENFPVEFLVKIFEGIVKAILSYGVEIWGCYSTGIIDRVGNYFVKSILGVSKSMVNGAALKEVGMIKTSRDIEAKWVAYAYKLKWEQSQRELQRICFRESFKGSDREWGRRVEKKVKELGLETVWESGNQNLKIIKSLIKRKVRKKGEEDIKAETCGKKSLEFWRKLEGILCI